jgi:hypothetical protein
LISTLSFFSCLSLDFLFFLILLFRQYFTFTCDGPTSYSAFQNGTCYNTEEYYNDQENYFYSKWNWPYNVQYEGYDCTGAVLSTSNNNTGYCVSYGYLQDDSTYYYASIYPDDHSEGYVLVTSNGCK